MDSNPKAKKKPLDPVVRIGLCILFGGFLLIFGGMYISRPDRTIPPFSNGWQEDTVVAVHVPAWTSDPEIETLIRRFREVVLATNDLRKLKIRPTNPTDPKDLYREVTIYIFSDPTWTHPDTLHRYLEKKEGKKERVFHLEFEQAARGGFIHIRGKTKGWLGPIPESSKPEEDQNIQVLFNEIPKRMS
jgi:hypothetical protein